MVRANKRNEALRIESALLNKIAMLGTEKTAEAVGVDKSQISRWKRDWIPKFSMLLAVPCALFLALNTLQVAFNLFVVFSQHRKVYRIQCAFYS